MKKVEAGPLWPTPVLYVEDEALNWEVVELRLGQRFALKWAKSDEEACAKVTCPIFFVTAYGDLYSGPSLTEAGADGWLPKPVDFMKLLTLLARANAMRAVAALKPPGV